MKILHKYVLKEHLGPFTFALTALTSILLLNYIAKQFGALVGKGLPWQAIGEFFALSIPFTVALTLPMAVLVAVLYAFSRLAADNEITALKASGVGMITILAPVLLASIGVTLAMLFFNDQILPRTNHELAVLQGDIAQKKPTFALREQVINEVSPGKFYLRANRIEKGSNWMHDVSIYDMSNPTRRRTIYADSGTLAMAANRTDLLMTLYNGTMQDVPTANPAELQRLFFQTDGIRVKGVANQFNKTSMEGKGPREKSVCEMQSDVDRDRQAYLTSQEILRSGIKRARTFHVKLDPLLTDAKFIARSQLTLGGMYCSIIGALDTHVQKWRNTREKRTVPRQLAIKYPLPIQQRSTLGAAPAQVVPPTPTPSNIPPTTGQMRFGQERRETPQQVRSTMPEGLVAERNRLTELQLSIASSEVEIHKKFALASACFVFVLLGAPVALRFPRAGVGLTIGVSLFVFALYYIGLIAGASLGSRGIVPAWVSMWAPNAIFTMAGIALVGRMNKHGGSVRSGDTWGWLDSIARWVGRRVRGADAPAEHSSERRTTQ